MSAAATLAAAVADLRVQLRAQQEAATAAAAASGQSLAEARAAADVFEGLGREETGSGRKGFRLNSLNSFE